MFLRYHGSFPTDSLCFPPIFIVYVLISYDLGSYLAIRCTGALWANSYREHNKVFCELNGETSITDVSQLLGSRMLSTKEPFTFKCLRLGIIGKHTRAETVFFCCCWPSFLSIYPFLFLGKSSNVSIIEMHAWVMVECWKRSQTWSGASWTCSSPFMWVNLSSS